MQDYYHGTLPDVLPQVLCQGIRPVFGAGADSLMAHYGVPVPGVYVAKSLKVATTYPIYNTTGYVEVQGSKHRDGLPGGTVISDDGVLPIRCVRRFVGFPNSQLWHKGSNQTTFRPEDLYCTHMVFYAVGPHLTHSWQLTRTVLDNLPQVDWYQLTITGGSRQAEAGGSTVTGGSQQTEASDD